MLECLRFQISLPLNMRIDPKVLEGSLDGVSIHVSSKLSHMFLLAKMCFLIFKRLEGL